MKRLMVYPYTREAETLVRFSDYLQGLEVSALVELKGWGRFGEEHRCHGKKLAVIDDIEKGLSCSDVLCVVNTHLELSVKQWIMPVIEQAIEAQKEVWICRHLTLEEKQLIQDLPGERKITFFSEAPPRSSAKPMSLATPIIAVAGTVPNTEKWAVQISMKLEFERQGYKVLLIGTRKEAALFGGYSIPDYLFETDLNDVKKIKSFNNFVATLESKENPDIILLGIPGCIVTYDPNIIEDFGVTAFQISQAVDIDQFVICTLTENYPADYFEKSSQFIEERLGAPVSAFHIAPYIFDGAYMQENNTVSFIEINRAISAEIIKQFESPIVQNLTDRPSVKKICEMIVEQYSEFGSVQLQS